MKNSINWFEIPVKNFDKAKSFYETVLASTIQVIPGNPAQKYGVLAYEAPQGVSGAIVEGPGYEPNMNGSVIYLNGGKDLAEPLGKVVAAGGKILLPKTSLGDMGFMALFIDTEGNKVGLHSMG